MASSTRLAAGLLPLIVLLAGCGERRPADPGGARQATSAPPESSALSTAFALHDVVGTMVVRRLSDGHEWIHAPARADSAFLPASTFKIANAAIALETGVVQGAEDRFEWDGIERGNAAWNRDHTLKSAMAASAVPVYQRIARRVGAERMTTWLRRVAYGNADIRGGIDRFWLTGELRTSAREQVDFLSRFVTGATDFSPHTVEVVSSLILIEEGPGWELHAKTGWADQAAIGWWSGWTRVGDEVHTFALNIVMPDVEAAPKRIAIGKEALVAVGALPRAAP